MAKLQVEKCCFFFDLRIGTIVILVLNALGALMLLLNGSGGAGTGGCLK